MPRPSEITTRRVLLSVKNDLDVDVVMRLHRLDVVDAVSRAPTRLVSVAVVSRRCRSHTGFGKYFELLFDRFGTPKGGVVTNYLLEKSRTVKPGQGERNFHVFYQLVQGAPRDERSRLCLLDSADAYPSLASCTSVEGIDDQKEFNDTAKAMADVGLDDATADLSLRVVAACLALGLLSFAPLAVGDAEGSQIRESAPLEAACSLLHLDPTALKDALASRTLETMAPGSRTETYQVPLNPTQASLARDALVKSIYSKLFDELVEQARAQRIYLQRGRVDGVSVVTRGPHCSRE